MENHLALLKEYLNRNFILQVKEAYQKNIFKGYIPHENRYVPQDALEIYSPHHLATTYRTLFSIRSIFLKFVNVLEH